MSFKIRKNFSNSTKKSLSISEYFKNPNIGNHYKEHFQSTSNHEIRLLSFTTDLKKVKFFLGKEQKKI